MKKLLTVAGFVLAAALPVCVLAQAVTNPVSGVSTTVDFTQVAIACLPIALGAVAFFLRQILVKLIALFHVQNGQAVLSEWDTYAPLALASAQSKLAPMIVAKGFTVDVKNALVKEAVDFMNDHAIATAKSGTIDGGLLAERFEAMINLNTVPANDSIALPSPATPPAVPAVVSVAA